MMQVTADGSVCKMAAEDHEEKEARVIQRGGASFVHCRPVFTPDSKLLLVASGNVVKVLSVASGHIVRTLKGHKAKVTSININPHNQFQVYSSSDDSSIIKWDYVDGMQLKHYMCPRPLYSIIPTQRQNVLVGIQPVNTNVHQVVRVTLPDGRNQNKAGFHMLHNATNHNGRMLALSPKSEFVASIYKNNLTISFLNKGQSITHSAYQKLTCVTCHPRDECLATGTEIGQVILWWKFLQSKSKIVVQAVYHWHSLPLLGLVFTSEGSYMLSGGHECVLVKWRYNSPEKDTLPRLGAPIIGISCSSDNQYYATCHTDNTIQVINSNFKIIQYYVGLVQGHLDEAVEQRVPTGLLLDPRTSALVLNGRPGYLQFYSLHSDSELYSLDIVCQNYISPDSLTKPLVLTVLEKAAFSHNGDWLVTVERRDDGVTSVEQRLKFWAFDQKQQMYTLNTKVDLPHFDPIVTVRFRPPHITTEYVPMVITTSTEGKFKVWQLVDDTDIYKKRSCWVCESVGFYRNTPAGAADFAEDGSVLAVAFGETLTLWEPDTNALKATLRQNSTISHVMFGRGVYSHLVTVATEKQLLVWNLVTCSTLWMLNVRVAIMVQDDASGVQAVFSTDRDLYVFEPSKSEAIFKKTAVSPSQILSAIFVPHQRVTQESTAVLPWQHTSQLYFLTETQELLTVTCDDDDDVTTKAEAEPASLVPELLPSTPFSLLLSEQRKKASAKQETDRQNLHPGVPGSTYLKEMLNTPAHVLPPVSSLCMSFMDNLMVTSKKSEECKKDPKSDEEENSEDVESDSESDMEVDRSEPTMEPAQSSAIPSDQKKGDRVSKDYDVRTMKDIDSRTLDKLTWINTL